MVEQWDKLKIEFKGGEYLFEGLDGAEVSNETLEFLIDV